MYRDMCVAVVVPAHNEELLVARVIETAPELVDHVIVVDDASTDDTSRAAEAVGDPRAEVHRLPENQGVGGAIVHGHRRALELGCDVSVVMAGDAQMDPAYLPRCWTRSPTARPPSPRPTGSTARARSPACPGTASSATSGCRS